MIPLVPRLRPLLADQVYLVTPQLPGRPERTITCKSVSGVQMTQNDVNH